MVEPATTQHQGESTVAARRSDHKNYVLTEYNFNNILIVMLNFNEPPKRRLIPERRQYKIPFRWIVIGAVAVILLAIVLYFKRVFTGQ
jgi:hypothetical protein